MKNEKFGARGEWWVVAQFILIPLLLLLTWLVPWGRGWPAPLDWLGRIAGLLLLMGAAWLLFAGVLHLGRNLTANPKPIDDGQLVQTGAYAVVRHPIYAGIIIGFLALALFFNSLVGVIGALILLIFFDQKSRREEVWLANAYAGYADYKRRTRKLIPFIF
jgi:protein-S-isoprenylcysteine O-methyltransferase Ste14